MIVVSFIVVFLLAAFATKINESKMQTFKWLEGSWEMEKKNGSSIIEFEAEMDARNCFSEVKVNGWSAADQKIINSITMPE